MTIPTETLRRWYPERDYDDPLLPWPYRVAETPMPTHCPKCGRWLIHFWWHGEGSLAGYHDVACAGPLNVLLVFWPAALLFIHHFEMTVGENDRPKSWHHRTRYDPMSGEPMDGAS